MSTGAGITRDVTIRVRVVGPTVTGGGRFGVPTGVAGPAGVAGTGAARAGIGAAAGTTAPGALGLSAAGVALGARGGGSYERRLRDIARGTRDVTNATRGWSTALGSASFEAARLLTWSRAMTRITFGAQEAGLTGAAGFLGAATIGTAAVLGLAEMTTGAQGVRAFRDPVGRAAGLGQLQRTVTFGLSGRRREQQAIRQQNIAAMQMLQQKQDRLEQFGAGVRGVVSAETRFETAGLQAMINAAGVGGNFREAAIFGLRERQNLLRQRRELLEERASGFEQRAGMGRGPGRRAREARLQGAQELRAAGEFLGNLLVPGQGERVFGFFAGRQAIQGQSRIESRMMLQSGQAPEAASRRLRETQSRLAQLDVEDVNVAGTLVTQIAAQGREAEQSIRRQLDLTIQMEASRRRELESLKAARLGAGFALAQAPQRQVARAARQFTQLKAGERVRNISPLLASILPSLPPEVLQGIQRAQIEARPDVRALLDDAGLFGFGPAITDARAGIEVAQGRRESLEKALETHLVQFEDAFVGALQRYTEIANRAGKANLEKERRSNQRAESKAGLEEMQQ